MHVPVLLYETIRQLDPQPGELFVDGTLGLGGHAGEALPRLSPGGTLLGLDLDPTRLDLVQRKLAGEALAKELDVQVAVRHASYADLPAALAELGRRADCLLLDLGFASDQLAPERGFSFTNEGPLQMTYDPSAPSLLSRLRGAAEAEVAEAIREYGGERYWRRIARAIVLGVRSGAIATTADLRDVAVGVVPRAAAHGGVHPATRTFQALRIWANRELEHLAAVLAALPDVAAPGARVAVISFHSLEDGMVRDAFRRMAKDGLGKAPAKATAPSLDEVVANPRSRSARLRTFTFTK